MKGGLDTDAGVQEFEIGRRVREDEDCTPWHRRRECRSIRSYKVRIRRGLKLHFGRRIGLDKVLECERLTTVLRTYRLLARMLTTTVRRCVGSETEQKLRAREAVTPKQSAQQQESQDEIGDSPHRNQNIAGFVEARGGTRH